MLILEFFRNLDSRNRRSDRKIAEERGQSFNIDIITGGTEEAGMPRLARREFAGAMDHVMARGDRREAIVRDDGDRRTFVRTLGEASGGEKGSGEKGSGINS